MYFSSITVSLPSVAPRVPMLPRAPDLAAPCLSPMWPPMMDLWPDQTVEMMLESCSNTAKVRPLPRAEPSLSDPLHWGFFCSPLTFSWEKEQVTSRNCFKATGFHGSTSCFPCWPPSVAKAFLCFHSYQNPVLIPKYRLTEILLLWGKQEVTSVVC